MPPSKLQVYEAAVFELRDRRRKTTDHLVSLQQQHDRLYKQWIKRGGSTIELERVDAKIKDVKYALGNMLPDAYARAFRKWLLEYWIMRGRVALPREISDEILKGMGSSYVRKIEREVEAQLISMGY